MAKRPPLPLDEEAELVGEWWLPGEEDRLASGRLVYTPATGVHIDVVSRGGVFKDFEPVAWVLGLTADGRRVTLRDCEVLDWRMNVQGGRFGGARVHARARARQAFIGMHAISDAELRMHSLHARMANLGGWLNAPAIEIEGAFPRGGRIDFRRLGEFDLGRTRGVLLTALVDLAGSVAPARNPQVLTLEQRPWVMLGARSRRPFDELFGVAETFRGFLSFAVGLDLPFLELQGTALVVAETLSGRRRYTTEEPVWILFAQRERGMLEEQPTERMLFRYADLETMNLLPLARWLRRAELMQPVHRLYLTALPARALYLEHRFVTFVQALEALYSRKHGKEKDLKPLLEDFVTALPRGLRRHVPPAFAEDVKNTRHYLTHWNPKKEAKAAKGERLFALTRGLKVLFDLVMLRELGFSQRQIQKLVQNNQRLVRDVDGSWRSL
jgi:hypothetical protein